jgi:hypothetical protein
MPAPNAELLRSLGRLVRGLSALFWGLPLALIVCFHTARADSLKTLGVIPPLVTTGLLVFGLWQLGDFQKQERIWRVALDRARLFSLVNFGLSPFLYWWNKIPMNTFFMVMVALMSACGLIFLCCLNLVVRRLSAMLPDEGLRLETRQWTSVNLKLLSLTFALGIVYVILQQFHKLPLWLATIAVLLDKQGFWMPALLVLVLLPLAMTMALLWKTKEVILENVFSAQP